MDLIKLREQLDIFFNSENQNSLKEIEKSWSLIETILQDAYHNGNPRFVVDMFQTIEDKYLHKDYLKRSNHNINSSASFVKAKMTTLETMLNKLNKAYGTQYYFSFSLPKYIKRSPDKIRPDLRPQVIRLYNQSLDQNGTYDSKILEPLLKEEFGEESFENALTIVDEILNEVPSLITDSISLKPVIKKDLGDAKININKSITTPAICFLLFAYYKSKGCEYDDFEKNNSTEIKDIFKIFKGRYDGDVDWLKQLNAKLKELSYKKPKASNSIHDYFRYKKLFGIKELGQQSDIIAIDRKKVTQHIYLLKRDLKPLISDDISDQFRFLKNKPNEFFKSNKDIHSSKTITIN